MCPFHRLSMVSTTGFSYQKLIGPSLMTCHGCIHSLLRVLPFIDVMHMLGYAKHSVKQCRVPARKAGKAQCLLWAMQGQCLSHAFLASRHLSDNQDMDMHVQVRRVPVTTEQMGLPELSVKQPKTEQIRTFEASLRLDAIASAGFRISRGKAADLIKHGDVRCGTSFLGSCASRTRF